MVQTSLTTTGQRLAIWGDWSGFTIVDRLGAQLIPHLFGATNRFPEGRRVIFYNWRSSSGVTKPNALRLILLRIAS
jgi:predicted phage gp36 major capsid-like protein